MENKIIIYSDGGADNNGDRVGGWGAVLLYKEQQKQIYGGVLDTTNNRMELTAIIEALKRIKKKHIPIEIYSDSAYIVNCFNDKWYVKWRKNGWKNSQRKPVENKDLWEELIQLVESFKDIEFIKVKGHAGIEFNELADALATKGIEEMRKNKE